MLARCYTLVVLAIASALIGCATPPPPPPPKPIVVGPPTDTVKVPLTDLLSKTYYSNPGGLYPGGVNQPPADHDSAARARRNAIKPLDVNGDESPFGKYVLISIGMSNATQEWCSQGSGPPCAPWTFMGKAAADPSVNHYTLVIVNGAGDGQDAPAWTSPGSPNYDRIKLTRLAPLGLSENQVQAAWVKLEDPKPSVSLPADSADAQAFLTNLGLVLRAMRIHYPNLRIVFLSSRTYGGYATIDLNPEPYAYESGFSVKWAIESQINEMRGLPFNARAGTLNYTKKLAPLIMWGPYLWANGATPRSDGLVWNKGDFEEDGTHPSQNGESKVAGLLMEFFKSSPYTRCWFLANQYCL
ncbi:MAG TPA: hypothetical protein VGO75_15365 [Gemmatimonadaceae bacterium]|nr:hypothetical protein [Gemmatimonadaceae bacterium]